MNNIRLPEPEIEAALVEIQTALAHQVSADDPHGVADHLTTLAALCGRSSVVQSSARFVRDTAHKFAVETAFKKGLAGNAARDYAAALCAHENGLYELAERQNSALDRQMNAYRSVLSFAKTELQNLK